MATTASRVNFDNVTTMGISYAWSQGQSFPCSEITNQDGRNKKWVKRVKTVDLEVANLDLLSAGGQVIQGMAANQSEYVNTDLHSIYANDVYAGHGKLSSYSINEGSLSNGSITNLSYFIEDGGPDKEDPLVAIMEEDPVSRSESITVSRDIKGKTYTIDHSYAVSFGDDFDLVSDYPLYTDDPDYKSVYGRLELAQAEATEAVNKDITNYNDYIDLSPYLTQNGWNFSKINNACSGVFTSSSETKDFINGDYDYSKTTILRYTGQDIEEQIASYDVSYTIGWVAQRLDNDAVCATLTFDGQINGQSASMPNNDCSTGLDIVDAQEAAESGYAEWVSGTNPTGLVKVKEFYNAVLANIPIPGSTAYPIVDKILNSKKTECVSSVQRGASNNGTIEFSFEVSACPEEKMDGNTPYNFSQSTEVSYSKGSCEDEKRRVTTISVNGNVGGQCATNLAADGSHPRWDSVQGVYEDLKGSGFLVGPDVYNGEYTLRLASESTTINEYEGQGQYSYEWTDSAKDADCNTIGDPDDCYSIITKSKIIDPVTRYANTVTTAGIASEEKGQTLTMKEGSLELTSKNTGNLECEYSADEVLAKAVALIEASEGGIKPACAILELDYDVSKKDAPGGDLLKFNSSIKGVEKQ